MQRKTNKQKFQELNRKQKIEYIRDYYTWHILGTIFGIVAIIYIINFINRPEPPVYSADLVVTGIMVVDEEALNGSRATMQEAVDGGVATLPTDWSSMDQMAYINDQLMMVKMATHECDLIAASEYKFDLYMNVEAFDALYPLDSIPELEPILEKYEDQLIIGQLPSDTEDHVYGIRIDELKNVEGITFGEQFVLSMIEPPKDLDAAVDLIYYVLGEE